MFHLVAPDVWSAARRRGEYRPDSLAREGFVHLSFAEQVIGTANLRFGEADDLVAVEIDSARLPEAVVVEDSYGSGTAFPHVYAPIPTSAAVAVHPMRRGDDGQWAPLSDCGASGPASGDR